MYKKKREVREVRGLKWCGSFLLLIGLCFTSFNVYPLNLYFMTIGCIVWVSVILLNVVGFIISITGLVNYWI